MPKEGPLPMAPTRTAALGAALSLTLGGAAAASASFTPLFGHSAPTTGDAMRAARLGFVRDRLVRRDAGAGRTRRRARHHRATASPVLQAIAACESGGDPHAIGGGGAFRGKYQFTYDTWASVGGSGDPAAASPAEQDRRAAMLYARTGPASWPVCGRQ
jgi:hypothetical protein